jgi:hypothetical protein
MIRYRLFLLLACLLAALLYLAAWRAADATPQVLDAGEGLAVPLDDAAIYFQYAKQALQGEWLRYSPGAELSTGVTSPLYFILLTGLMGLGLSGPWAAWILGAASLILGMVAMDGLGRRLFPALPPWWAPLLLLSHGAWIGWHFNGMETGLLLALSLAAALTALRGSRRDFLAMAALLAFTRPEGQLLAALLVLARSWDRKDYAVLCAGLAWAGLPSLALLALSGGLVPDSLRPKSAVLQGGKDAWALMAQASDHAVALIKGAWLGLWSGQDSVGAAGDATSRNPIAPVYAPGLLLAALIGFFNSGRGPDRRFWLALAAGLAGLAGLLSWQLPVGWHSHRYQAAATPLLWLGALAFLQALRSAKGLGRPAAAALLTLWTAFGLASWPWHLQRTFAGAEAYAESNRNAALNMARLPAGSVAIADAGLLAYYSGRSTVDLLGVTDHGMALAQSHGRGAVLEELLSRDPLPAWAALHEQRPDVDLSPWLTLGLLYPLDAPPPGQGMRFYAWNWHAAGLQDRTARLPSGGRIVGRLNVAYLPDELASAYQAQGPQWLRSRMLNLRLGANGDQVPEGGRWVEEESFLRQGDALILRAVFDRPGRLLIAGPDGRTLLVSAIDASPSAHYSELWLPLPDGSPRQVTVRYEDEKGQPSAWTSCHYWFVEREMR